MVNKITFNTGRGYTKEGQIIHAVELEHKTVDVSVEQDGSLVTNEHIIFFEDVSRSVEGVVRTNRFDEEAILYAYDQGGYESVGQVVGYDSEKEKPLNKIIADNIPGIYDRRPCYKILSE